MVSLVCFFIASMLWAVMNTLTFHHANSIFGPPSNYKFPGKYSFWGALSWLRKYEIIGDGPTHSPALSNWYYKTFKIDYKERFPGSATIFVWLTDGYHLTQFFFLWAITIAVVTCPFENAFQFHRWYDILIRALLLRGIWWIGFNSIFTLLKKR